MLARACGTKGLRGHGAGREGTQSEATSESPSQRGGGRAAGRAACETWLFRKSLRVSAPILDARGVLSRDDAPSREIESRFLYSPREVSFGRVTARESKTRQFVVNIFC